MQDKLQLLQLPQWQMWSPADMRQHTMPAAAATSGQNMCSCM